MRTDCDTSDAVGVAAVAEESVACSPRADPTAKSKKAQRVVLVLAADSPRFTVIALSVKSARILGAESRAACGGALAETLWLTRFDEEGIDTAELSAFLGRVVRTGKPQSLPMRWCHITHPTARSGSETGRWWSILGFPMLGSDGRVTQIVLRLEDVTVTAKMQLADEF
jgi:hypothetical protein